jgi:hypothetical protein
MRQIIDSIQLSRLFQSSSRDAQELLPHVIRKLVAASVDVGSLKSLRIPGGDDIGRQGYDGVVQVTTGNPYIPQGISVWEMSTNALRDTAQDNYRKRTEYPGSITPADTAFIYVTPHRCDWKEDWLKDRRSESKWRAVQVIDDVDLASWLEGTPSVARWLAAQLGLAVDGVRDLDLFQRELKNDFDQKLFADLLIGGRSESETKLSKWIQSDSVSLRIEGESFDEVAAFVAAAISKLSDNLNDQIGARVVFIDKPDALNFFAAPWSTTIAIPTTPETSRRLRAIPAKGMRVIIPGSRFAGDIQQDADSIKLGTIKRDSCKSTLEAIGMLPARADRIARESKGSLTALLWMVSQVSDTPLPWTVGVPAFELAPLVLAGQWAADNEIDKAAIAELCGRPYSEIERTLAEWQAPQGPLVRRSMIWDWRAWDFAWATLASQMNEDRKRRFAKVVTEVLATPDPRFSLPAKDRWASNVKGKVHPHSAQLRAGIVGSLVQFALNDAAVPSGNGQAIADSQVRALLNVQPSDQAMRWLSLSPWLPDLAEASPDEFLTSAEAVANNPTAVSAIFEDGGFLGSNPHTYILWALERLAWLPNRLTRVTLLLGKLAASDPGGQLQNCPSNTLRAIFLPWFPQTTADVATRLSAIEALYDRFPDIGWKVAVGLLPRSGDIAHPTDKPRWQEWGVRNEKGATTREYWDIVAPLFEKMLIWAGNNGGRWCALIEAHDHFRPGNADLARRIVDTLRSIDTDQMADQDLSEINNSLRSLLSQHRETRDADWSMNETELQAMEELYAKFRPRALPDQFAWLFNSWPNIAKARTLGVEKQMEQVEEERLEAVRTIYSAEGLNGVIKLAASVERPDAVGFALSKIPITDAVQSELLKTALDIELLPDKKLPSVFSFGLGFIGASAFRKGEPWIDSIMSLQGISWSALMLANLAWGLPPTAETWDKIDGWGSDVSELYWRRTPLHGLSHPERDAERAIESLLKAGRPLRALDLAGMYVRGSKNPYSTNEPLAISRELILKTLREAAKDATTEEWYRPALRSVAHEIGLLLDALEMQGVDMPTLVQLEWLWLPLLEDTQRGFKALSLALSENPELFVDMLKLIFRGDGDEPRESSQNDRARAMQAYKLLEAWHRVPGGADSPSSVKPSEGEIAFPNGSIDKPKLFQWVDKARALSTECRRIKVCDSRIGNMLAYSYSDADGTWPCEPVRELLEIVQSVDIEHGIAIGVYNKRGVHARAKGGDQERVLAAKFQHYEERVRDKWPRAANLLQQISQSYLRDARREDEQQDFEEFE